MVKKDSQVRPMGVKTAHKMFMKLTPCRGDAFRAVQADHAVNVRILNQRVEEL